MDSFHQKHIARNMGIEFSGAAYGASAGSMMAVAMSACVDCALGPCTIADDALMGSVVGGTGGAIAAKAISFERRNHRPYIR